jgi:YHS domain-containing protein
VFPSPLFCSAQTEAMNSYCPVTILDDGKWEKGNTRLQTTYDNRIYYFSNNTAKQKFDANPPKYIPALGGDCIVCIVNVNQRIAGSVFYSVRHKNRLYLFPQNKSKKLFTDNPEKFEDADLAFNGNCPVCRKGGTSEAGNPKFTVIVNGIRYQLASKEIMEEFKRNPKNYSQ